MENETLRLQIIYAALRASVTKTSWFVSERGVTPCARHAEPRLRVSPTGHVTNAANKTICKVADLCQGGAS